MTRKIRLAALVGTAIYTALAPGCSQTPFHDDSYEAKIPAALEAADLGIADASASATLDGFSETLVVGGRIDSSVVIEKQVPPQLIQRVISVALDGRDVDTSYFRLALSFGQYEFVDTDLAFTALGANPRSDGSITMEEAERIAREDLY
ncbi:hypothetical protein [Microbacterium testaceum]|uniref:hypothetical protein n=1 Tax=Microbacterium testaceum TaxID=2033 RepID=UPI0022E084C2|nr:hypothetical protein [Microbacterium testaceum]